MVTAYKLSGARDGAIHNFHTATTATTAAVYCPTSKTSCKHIQELSNKFIWCIYAFTVNSILL